MIQIYFLIDWILSATGSDYSNYTTKNDSSETSTCIMCGQNLIEQRKNKSTDENGQEDQEQVEDIFICINRNCPFCALSDSNQVAEIPFSTNEEKNDKSEKDSKNENHSDNSNEDIFVFDEMEHE